MSKFLVYEDSKGVKSSFEIEPKFIKGKNLAVKNIETGRQKSFSMNLTLGLFDTKDEAEALLKELESFQLESTNPKCDKLRENAHKLREKSEKLNEKYDKFAERLEKKEDTLSKLDEKEVDDLTDKQFERHGKLEAELEILGDKDTDLQDEIYNIEQEADKIEEEADQLEEDISNAAFRFEESKRAECASRIKALGLEVKVVIPKVKKVPSPPLPQKKTGKGLIIAASIIIIILVVILCGI